jgi:autotransporter-associated beta strand protein
VITDNNGTWASSANGYWENAANWSSNTIASGIDKTATFNGALGTTVTLLNNFTIGNLAFSVEDYTIAGATLTLDASATTPFVSVGSGSTATISANLAGIAGLEKTGAGTLVLTAANTYSGATTVSAGTLILDGASGGTSRIAGDLIVNSGATVAMTNGDTTGLGYNPGNKVTSLTIDGGTVTTAGVTHIWNFSGGVNMTGGTLQSNNGVSDANGSQMEWINANVFTNASADTATIAGRIRMRGDGGVTGINFTVADGTAATDLLVSAAVTQASAGLGISKNDLGTMLLSGINTYTGNTTINEGTLVLADDAQLTFAVTDAPVANMVTGAGTATFNGDFNIDTSAVAGITGYIWLLVDRANLNGESFGSTFNVIGFTEQGDGVTWTMTDAKGNWSFSEDTGELTLDVGSDYDDWVSANGVVGTETDDDDNDGRSNFEEYAFGTDPTGGSSVNPIIVPLDKTTRTISYTRRTQSLSDLTYSVWFSTDLATWTQDTGATEGTPAVNGEVETVEVTLSTLPGDPLPAKLFVQVRAQ